MEKIDEVLELLRKAVPMLTEFSEWKKNQELEERAYQQEQTDSQKEFDKWLSQRQAEQAQESADADELKRHFFGGSEWEKERLIPKRF